MLAVQTYKPQLGATSEASEAGKWGLLLLAIGTLAAVVGGMHYAAKRLP